MRASCAMHRLQGVKTYRELSMSPNLLAFNMFASEMRLVLRDPTLLSRAEMQMGIEKVIGNRWKAMTPEEKEKHIDKARVEQARLIAEGGMPSAPSNTMRAKKQKAPGSANEPAPKRRRGRPPKTGVPMPFARPKTTAPSTISAAHGFSDFLGDEEHSQDERDPYSLNYNDHNLSDLFMPFNPSHMPIVTNQYDHHHHHLAHSNKSHHDVTYDPSAFLQHISVIDSDTHDSEDSHLKSSHHSDLTGTKVEGCIDGSFDNGYFMTVRVNGQTLRGMLYREEACLRAIGAHAQS